MWSFHLGVCYQRPHQKRPLWEIQIPLQLCLTGLKDSNESTLTQTISEAAICVALDPFQPDLSPSVRLARTCPISHVWKKKEMQSAALGFPSESAPSHQSSERTR